MMLEPTDGEWLDFIPGQSAGRTAPAGRCPTAPGRDVVLVAGSIGLAPLRPAMLEALHHRQRYDRVVLLYGGRSPEDQLVGDELKRWENLGVEVLMTVEYGTSSWTGRVGLVSTLITRAGFDPRSTLALVCGPEIMVRLAAAALIERGVRPTRSGLGLDSVKECSTPYRPGLRRSML